MPEFHTPLPKDNANTIQKAIQKIRNDNLENLYVFKKGEQLRRFKGSTNKISIQNNYLFEFENNTLVHNHPSGSSFSTEDVQTIIKFNVKEAFVVTKDYLFHLSRPGSNWPIKFDEPITSERLTAAVHIAEETLNRLVSKNDLSRIEKDKEFFHYIWEIFFQFYEIKYHKISSF